MKVRRTTGGVSPGRGLLIGFGVLAMGYAFLGALTDPDLKLGGVVLFLGAVLALHDAVFLPFVIGVGALLTRSHPLARAVLIVSLAVTVVALPFVLGYGRTADNPSALPLAYGKGLAVILVAIWTPTLVFLTFRRSRDGRRGRRSRANRQKIVRMRTTHPGPSDG